MERALALFHGPNGSDRSAMAVAAGLHAERTRVRACSPRHGPTQAGPGLNARLVGSPGQHELRLPRCISARGECWAAKLALLLLLRRVGLAICVLWSARSHLKFSARFYTGSILGSLVETCCGGPYDLHQWRLACAHLVSLVGSYIRPLRRLSASSSFSRYIFGEAEFLGIWRVRWISRSFSRSGDEIIPDLAGAA
jgi:hypothetical protein